MDLAQLLWSSPYDVEWSSMIYSRGGSLDLHDRQLQLLQVRYGELIPLSLVNEII